ncbi:MAG: PhoU domain-containing protein [Candidatus Helarchaeota archaeon]
MKPKSSKKSREAKNSDEKIFEIRKIQITGGSTYLISLPKKWVRKINLGEHAQVAIYESDIYEGSLIINPHYTETEKTKEITIKIVDDEGFDLSREIIAAYLFGYDVIRIESDQNISPNERDEIKKTTQKLIGIEIMEESSKIISLQCLISPMALPLEKTIDRIFLIVSQMLKDAIQAIITNDEKLADNVVDRDNEVNRLYFLCVRQLRSSIQDANIARMSKITPLECLDYRVIAKALENAGDYIVEMIKIFKNNIVAQNIVLPNEVKNELSEISFMIYKLMTKAKKVMETHLMKLAIEVIGFDKDKIKKKAENLKRKLQSQKMPEWALAIDSILDLLIKISDIAGVDIADLVMS